MARRSLVAALVLLLVVLAILLTRRSGERFQPPPESKSNPLQPKATDVPRSLAFAPRPIHQQPSVAFQPAPAAARTPSSPNGAFEGRVVSAFTRAGLARAQLTFSRAEEVSAVESGSDGEFHFDARVRGRWLLAAATAPGHQPFAPEWGQSPVVLDARPGEVVRGIIVTLFPISEYEGRIVDMNDKPIAGVAIRIFGAGVAASALVPLQDQYQSDARGAFRFTAPEEAVVEARRDGFTPGRARVDYSVRISRKLTIQLKPASGAGQLLGIEGVVEGPDQNPAEDALVSASSKQKPGEVPVTRRTDAQGRFKLTDLQPGVWRVMASRTGAAPAFADAPAGITGLRLRLSAGGRLSGRVTDGRGTPITLFTILVESEAPQTASFIDPNGRYEIGGLAPGPAVVSAVAPDHAPSNEMRVTIPQGDAPAAADFVLTKGGSLTGIVVERETGRHLGGAKVAVEGSASSAVPIRNETVANQDGKFVLDGLQEAPLGVFASAPDHHARIISVPAIHDGEARGPMTIELSPVQPGEDPRVELVGIGAVLEKRGDALMIINAIPGGGAAESGLGTGDEILAIDGLLVKPMTLSDAIPLLRGEEGTTIILTVVKAGDTRRVPVVVSVARRLIRG